MKSTNSHPPFFRRAVGPMSVIIVPRRGSGLASAQALIRRGSTDEGPGEIGVASFTASMLKRGTQRRTSAKIALDTESLGAMTSFGAGADASVASVQSSADDFPAALEIFFDCLRNPVFELAELEIERQSVLAYLKRIEDEKFDFTYRQYLRRIFAGHGYGHSTEGEIANVQAIAPERCKTWHSQTFHPANMLFVASGDLEPDALCAQLEKLTAGWTAPKNSPERYAVHASSSFQSERLVLKKELEQGFIVLGFRAPDATHSDHLALRLACAALGEGFAGRLFTHLRDERSLAYAVGSMLRLLRLGGHTALYIGTQPDRLEEAEAGLLAEAEHLRNNLLSAEDLNRAKNYVAGKYLMDHQSIMSRAGHLARWEDLGLGAEYDARYLDDLKRIKAKQIIEAANKWWTNPCTVILTPIQAK